MKVRAEVAAADVLATHDVPPRAPIDIDRLAARMGVSRVIERHMHGDGRLERDGRTLVIVVRHGAAWPRRRFTVAHELGHLWLASAGAGGMPPIEEERFCNR